MVHFTFLLGLWNHLILLREWCQTTRHHPAHIKVRCASSSLHNVNEPVDCVAHANLRLAHHRAKQTDSGEQVGEICSNLIILNRKYDGTAGYSLSRNYQVQENVLAMRLVLPLDLCHALVYSVYVLAVSVIRSNFDVFTRAQFNVLAHMANGVWQIQGFNFNYILF